MSHRYYLDDDNADSACDAGSPLDKDLVEAVPSGGTMTPSTADTSFALVATWDRDVSRDNPAGGTHSLTIDPFLLSADAEWRVRLRAIDGDCNPVSASAYSAAFTDGAAQTFTLGLSWPAAAVRLRLELELRSTGSGTKTIQIRPIAENYIDAPFVPATPRIRQISDEVVARLSTISLLRGHNFDIGNTGLDSPPPERITKVPAAFVWSEEFVQRQFRNVGDGPLAREAAALLEVRLFTRSTTARQDMVLLGADVVDVLEENPRLLGFPEFVVRLIVGNLQALKTDTAIEEPWHIATMTLEVLYRMPRGSI